MIIRPTQLLDIEKLSPLYAELGYPVKEAELVRRLKTVLFHPDYHLLVAVDDNEIIGMIGYAKMLFFENESAYYHILIMAVLQNYRRNGIATALLDAVKNWALSENIHALALNSGDTLERQITRRFYENYVFKEASRGYSLYAKIMLIVNSFKIIVTFLMCYNKAIKY